ncbi:MAG: hypothetical protein QM655_02950 [Nocardioidaceae bacterium]
MGYEVKHGIFKGVRIGDAVLAVALTAVGVLLMLGNIHDTTPDATAALKAENLQHAITSDSWLMLPVFALVTVPILWRRRNILAVVGVTAAALAVHVVAFDWVVRCGAGLPLAFALAYGVGRLVNDRGVSIAGFAATLVVQLLVLIRDAAAGIEILPVTAVLGAACWGAGILVTRLVVKRVGAPTLDAEPVRG